LNVSKPRCEHLSVARFGGDEFVILLKDAGARALAIQIADACAVKLKEPIEYGGLEFFRGPVSVSQSIPTMVRTLARY